MLEILERLCKGDGKKNDLNKLEELARQTQQGSLCGLGKTAPNPVLSTLTYFHEEYEAHLLGKCPSRSCKALIKYTITDNCIGCTICAQKCPTNAIPAIPYQMHEIIQENCTKCDTCRQVCPHDAVEII
jgi:NADH-quinone oxidoreductase subunit F